MNGSCSDEDDDSELEAEFQRELALLGDDLGADRDGSAFNSQGSPHMHHFRDQSGIAGCRYGFCSNDEIDSPSSSDSDPPSLRAFREALDRREAAMDELHSELLATAALITAPTPNLDTMPAVSAASCFHKFGNTSSGRSSSHELVVSPATTTVLYTLNGDVAAVGGRHTPSSDIEAEDDRIASGHQHSGEDASFPTLFSNTAEALASAIAAATASMLLAAPTPGRLSHNDEKYIGSLVSNSLQDGKPLQIVGQKPFTAAASRDLNVVYRPVPGAYGSSSEVVCASNSIDSSSGGSNVVADAAESSEDGRLLILDLERHAIRDQYRVQEAFLVAQREQKRVKDGQEAAEKLQVAEAYAQQQLAEVQRKAADAEQRGLRRAAVVQQQHDRDTARLLLEAMQMEERRKQSEERLAQMALQSAARAVLQQQVAAELSAQHVLHARLHLAASCIAHAWRCYRAGPVCALRIRRVVLLQALWRGVVARKRAGALAAQRAVLSKLEDAASSGLLEVVREAALQAEKLGVGSEAQQKLMCLESCAAAASKALTAAASGGSVMSMTAALLLASKFPHLAHLVQTAQAAFGGRRAGAEGQMQRAISDLPMSEVVSAMDTAAQMGLPSAALVDGLAAARKRDADMALALKHAAQQEPYDAFLFKASAERALQLGLKADVAACRHLVERRKRQMGVRMLAVGLQASAKSILALASAGRLLGLDSQAQELESMLQVRQADVLKQLQHCVDSAARLSSYNQAFKHARRAGVSAVDLSSVITRFEFKRREAVAALHAAAAMATLQIYRGSRATAIAYGCSSDDIEAGDSRIGSRRLGAAAALPLATRAVWRELLTLQRLHSQSGLESGKGTPHHSGFHAQRTRTRGDVCAGGGGGGGGSGQGGSLQNPTAGTGALPRTKCASASAAGLQLCSALADALTHHTSLASSGNTPANAAKADDVPHVAKPRNLVEVSVCDADPVSGTTGTKSVVSTHATAAVARAAAASAADAHAAAMLSLQTEGKINPGQVAVMPFLCNKGVLNNNTQAQSSAVKSPAVADSAAVAAVAAAHAAQLLSSIVIAALAVITGAPTIQATHVSLHPSTQQQQSSSTEQALLTAVQQLWNALLACLPLMLHANASAALASLALQCRLENADSDYIPAMATIAIDHWGVPMLPDWAVKPSTLSSSSSNSSSCSSTDADVQGEDFGGLLGCGSSVDIAASAGGAACGLQGGVFGRGSTAAGYFGGDIVTQHAVQRLQEGRGFPGVYVWPIVPQTQVCDHLWMQYLLGPQPASTSHTGPPHSSLFSVVPEANIKESGAQHAFPNHKGPGLALSRALLLANAPSTPLNILTKLDLSLERLSTLAGLDALCPTLTALTANSNQLSSLSGLGQLSLLNELSLKGNCLTSLHALPTARLQKLHLDGNRLTTPSSLTALLSCYSLHTLSLADNDFNLGADHTPTQGSRGSGVSQLDQGVFQAESLQTGGPGKEDSSAGIGSNAAVDVTLAAGDVAAVQNESSLAVLLLPGNRLSWLGGGLLRCCGNLVTLDVSRNQLTSLEGLHLVPRLRSLSAANNSLSMLQPSHLLLPYLTSLDLSHNALCTLPAALLLPSLVTLNLQGNRLTSLQPLHFLPSLCSLDLSFNTLPTLESLQALAPLSAITKLALHDNPLEKAGLDPDLAAELLFLPPQHSVRDVLRWPPYQQCAFRLLPWLQLLDGERVVDADVASHVWHAVSASSFAALATTRMLHTAGRVTLTTPAILADLGIRKASAASVSGSSGLPRMHGAIDGLDVGVVRRTTAAAAQRLLQPGPAPTLPLTERKLPSHISPSTLAHLMHIAVNTIHDNNQVSAWNMYASSMPFHQYVGHTARTLHPCEDSSPDDCSEAKAGSLSSAPAQMDTSSVVSVMSMDVGNGRPVRCRGSFLGRVEAGWAAAGRDQLLLQQAGDENLAGQMRTAQLLSLQAGNLAGGGSITSVLQQPKATVSHQPLHPTPGQAVQRPVGRTGLWSNRQATAGSSTFPQDLLPDSVPLQRFAKLSSFSFFPASSHAASTTDTTKLVQNTSSSYALSQGVSRVRQAQGSMQPCSQQDAWSHQQQSTSPLSEQQHHLALQGMRNMHRHELLTKIRGDLAIGSDGRLSSGRIDPVSDRCEPERAARSQLPVAGQLLLRSSYFQRLRQNVGFFATVIQAHWRGLCARRLAAHLRSSAYQLHVTACAQHIQRCWRGHLTRSSHDLARRRAVAAAAKSEAARLVRVEEARLANLEAERREHAAVKIQALARGFGVRRRLRAALDASRYVDDDDFDYTGLIDEDDSFLQGIEDFIKVERIQTPHILIPAPSNQPTAAVSASTCTSQTMMPHTALTVAGGESSAKGSPGQVLSQPITQGMHPLTHSQVAAGAHHDSPGSSAGIRLIRVPPLALQNPFSSADNGSESWAGAKPPLSQLRIQASQSQLQQPSPVQQQQQQLIQPLTPMLQPPAPVGPVPSIGTWRPSHLQAENSIKSLSTASGLTEQGLLCAGRSGGVDGRETSLRDDDEIGAESGSGLHTPRSIISTVDAAAAERNQRYSDKLHALMAEWGFSDVATAEAYYKRQQRQKAGSNAKRIEAKNRDPAVRLRNLQEAISAQPKQLRGQEVGVRQHQTHGPILPLHHPSLSPPGGVGNGSSSSSVAGVTSPPSNSLPARGAGPHGVASSMFNWNKVGMTSASDLGGNGGGGGGSSGGGGGGIGNITFLPRSLSQGAQLHQQSHTHNHTHNQRQPGEQNGITYPSPRTSLPLYGSVNLISDRGPQMRQRSDPSSGIVTVDDDGLSVLSFQSVGSVGGRLGKGEEDAGLWARNQAGALSGGGNVGLGINREGQANRSGPGAQYQQQQQQQQERRSVGRTLLPAMAQNWVFSADTAEADGNTATNRVKELPAAPANQGIILAGGLSGVGVASAASDARDMARRSLAAAEQLEQRARGLAAKM